eukprot:13910926-Ditylum_brightwellii.AAC.1
MPRICVKMWSPVMLMYLDAVDARVDGMCCQTMKKSEMPLSSSNIGKKSRVEGESPMEERGSPRKAGKALECRVVKECRQKDQFWHIS